MLSTSLATATSSVAQAASTAAAHMASMVAVVASSFQTAASASASASAPMTSTSAIADHTQRELNAEQREHLQHESTHALMGLFLTFLLLGTQVLLLLWRTRHATSFQLVTLLGLWVLPFILAASKLYFRFMTVWGLFSLANTWIVVQALRTPIESTTPVLVYKWYEGVYRVCYAAGSFGYLLGVAVFVGIAKGFLGLSEDQESAWFNFAFHIFFYGLYFGVLGRDFVDRLSDRMAYNIGYYNPKGFPKRHLRGATCAVCGNLVGETRSKVVLECAHVFHEACIRGWCIVGKKDCCPYCKEKVDTARFQRGSNVWDTQERLYLSLLDGVRYFLVWQPVILLSAGAFFRMVGWE